MAEITVLMNVYEGEEFFEYALKSIYDIANRIVIINGAYNDKMPSRYSRDKTERIVVSFSDKDNKLEYLKTYASTQVEQRNKVMDYINDGWLFIVDDDEIYKPDEIRMLSNFLDTAKEDAYTMNAFIFTNTFRWFYPYAFKRLFRYRPGMRFVAPNELMYDEGEYQPIRPIPKVTMYHYAYVKRKNKLKIKGIQRKIKLYWKGRWMIPRQLVQRFDGEHPEIMKDHPYRKWKWDAGEYEIC